MPELDDAALERRLRGVLQEHLGALPLDLTVDAVDRRREAKGVARRSGRGRGITLLAAAALLLVGGALAAGSGILRLPSVVPPVPAPSVVAVATTSPDATSPSPNMLASPTPVPSATPAPITWTVASLKEDWPAPVRAEPAGAAIVLPILLMVVDGQVESAGQHADGSWDTGSDVFPWVDIHEVGFCQGQTACIRITLVSNHPPVVDPAEQWIAYGVVVDDDGDGVADRRFGVDNSQVTAPGEDPQRRQWITDLHTGRTLLEDDFGETFFDTFYPPGAYGVDGARLSFGGDATGGGKIGGLPERYYAWASVIENGRVVATDYAPDAGWLAPSADAKP
jgi:hypothetical protein